MEDLEKVEENINEQEFNQILSKCCKQYINSQITFDEAINILSKEYAILAEKALDEEDINLSISELKKKIKHAKNPLEAKALNKQLNTVYKRKKRR